MIHASDVVFTYRTRIRLCDGRAVRPMSAGFLGPMSDDQVASGARPGRWITPVTNADRALDSLPVGDRRRPCAEWVSSADVASIRIVGTFDEWPSVVAEEAGRTVAALEGLDDD